MHHLVALVNVFIIRNRLMIINILPYHALHQSPSSRITHNYPQSQAKLSILYPIQVYHQLELVLMYNSLDDQNQTIYILHCENSLNWSLIFNYQEIYGNYFNPIFCWQQTNGTNWNSWTKRGAAYNKTREKGHQE